MRARPCLSIKRWRSKTGALENKYVLLLHTRGFGVDLGH